MRTRLFPFIFAIWLMLLPVLIAADQPTSSSSSAVVPDSYDVIVVGGEPEGVAAAVAAAREGKRVLLLVAESELGGLFTQAMLNTLDLNMTPQRELVNTGLFLEFYRAIGKREAFDVNLARQALEQLVVAESRLTVRFERRLVKPLVTDRKLSGVVVASPDGEETYRGRMLIDATADADLAAASGVAYSELRADIGQPNTGMGATLLLHLSGVDWQKLRKEAASGRLGEAASTNSAVWGFPDIATLYRPHDQSTFLRGLNVGRQENGTVLLNALVIFGVDPGNAESYQAGLARGKAEAEHVVKWLRQNVGGFSRAKLEAFPSALYVRESRHMQGLYRLTVSDVLSGHMFPDAIAFGSYPLDVQAASPTDTGFVVGNPKLYSIPIGCMVTHELDNLLVVGRSASYDSLAASSARTVPVGMTVGQAAGVSAAVLLESGVSAQNLVQPGFYQQVQLRLWQQGARWFNTGFGSVFPNDQNTPALRQLVERGLVFGGYSNDWQLDATADERLLTRLLAEGTKRVNPDLLTNLAELAASGQAGVPLTEERLCQLTENMLSQTGLSDWRQWLDDAVEQAAQASYTRGEVYRLVAEWLTWLEGK